MVVDAVNTAYAFQLYEMLKQKGLNKGDYEVKSVGGTVSRLEAMTKDKAMVAAIMNPPFSLRAVKAGLKDMGTAASALGAYQGTSAFVLRAWGQSQFRRSWSNICRPTSKDCAGASTPRTRLKPIALLAERLKLPREMSRKLCADETPRTASPDGAIDMDGVKNVLKLRAEFEGGDAEARRRNISTCLITRKRWPGFNASLFKLDIAVDLVIEADLADGQHHLRLDGFVAL